MPLSHVQGLLSTVQKSRDSHPPAAVRTLRFYLHTRSGGLRQVAVLLRTTGGDCRRVVERSLADLFAQCGLPRAFRWGEGAWGVLDSAALADRNRASQPAPDEPEAEAPPAAHDPDAVVRPRQNLRDAAGQPQELGAALAGMDPLLNAVAAVPWLPADSEGASRRHYIIHHVLRELATSGWALERGAAKVWAGQRDSAALAAEEMALGLDAASAEALKMIVYHARQLEAELGPPALN